MDSLWSGVWWVDPTWAPFQLHDVNVDEVGSSQSGGTISEGSWVGSR